MLKRPKAICGLLWFVIAGLNIAIHVMQYKRDEKPTGLRLVMATLNIMTGVFTLMSDALEHKSNEKVVEDIVGEDEVEEFDCCDFNCCCEGCDA